MLVLKKGPAKPGAKLIKIFNIANGIGLSG